MLAFHGYQAFILKMGEQATDGFHGQAQQIGNIVTRHAEMKFGGGEAAVTKVQGEAEQETGQAGLGRHLGDHHQLAVITLDLFTHDMQHMVLHGGNIASQVFQAIEGNFADTGGLQGHS